MKNGKPKTRAEFRAFLNATARDVKHKHHRYGQRTRPYGDYLYAQEKFEVDYQEWNGTMTHEEAERRAVEIVERLDGTDSFDQCVTPIKDALLAAASQGAKEMQERAVGLLMKAVKAYPTDVFIEPPAGQHGNTIDACSARALRSMLPRWAHEIAALPIEEEP